MRTTAFAVAIAVAVSVLAACQPTSSTVAFAGSSKVLVADAANKLSVKLSCKGTKTCEGVLRVRRLTQDTPAVTYAIPANTERTYQVRLTTTQLAQIPAGKRVPGEVRAGSLRASVAIERPAAPATIPTSKAYRERNWTPTAYDTCTAAFHRSFSVVGPDGKLYPGWHPPTAVDPDTGRSCTFGHEHGDDPGVSDIYTWVTDFLNADPAKGRGIPFGYVSEALDTYAAGRDQVTRHEDNVGHKVIVANDVKLVTAAPRTYLRDTNGAVISCDFLLKIHQGSHSGDALINNAHELLYAAKCSDGTEVISSTLTRFGNANEFNRSCSGDLVETSGSNLPAGDGGQRLIPDRFCVDRDVLVPAGQSSSIWALYEVWQSANDLTTADGTTLASFDPWFGVRNPARAHEGGTDSSSFDLVCTTDLVDPSDGGTANSYPFDQIIEYEGRTGLELTKVDPASPFDGAQRDFYLRATTVTNAGGPSSWYTTPYGQEGVTSPGPGLVRQHVSQTDNAAWPDLERRTYDLERDHGKDNGVHAPN